MALCCDGCGGGFGVSATCAVDTCARSGVAVETEQLLARFVSGDWKRSEELWGDCRAGACVAGWVCMSELA